VAIVEERYPVPDVVPGSIEAISTPSVVQQLAVAVLLINPDGCLAGANQAWTSLSGRSLAASHGRRWCEVIPAAGERERLLHELAAGSAGAVECRLITPAGPRRTRWLWGHPASAGEPRAVGVIDLTAPRAAEDGAARRAAPDLSGEVTDRRRFLDLVEQALRVVGGLPIGVVHADLECECLGETGDHVLGDKVLRSVVGRLRQHLRAGDVLGRVGGNAFAVLCTGAPREIVSVGSRLVAALQDPVAVEGGTVNVGATVGIALAEGPGDDPEALLGRAGRDVSAGRATARSGGGPDRTELPAGYSPITLAAADRAIRRTFLAGLLVASCHTRVDPATADRLAEALDEMDAVVKDLRSAIASADLRSIFG